MRLACALALCFGCQVGRADEVPPPGPPAQSARCKVRVVQAEADGKELSIDPRITLLRPYLMNAPFNGWKRFQLLSEYNLDIQPTMTAEFFLPNGKKTSLTYLEHLQGHKKHRMRLKLAIAEEDKKVFNTTFVLDEGGTVVQAGQRHDKALLILAVSCQMHE
jgi:hypothetical protein